MLIRSMQYMIGPSQCGLPIRRQVDDERVLNGIARHETPRHRLRGFAPRLSQEETGLEGFGCSAEAFIFFAHCGGESYSIHDGNFIRTQKKGIPQRRCGIFLVGYWILKRKTSRLAVVQACSARLASVLSSDQRTNGIANSQQEIVNVQEKQRAVIHPTPHFRSACVERPTMLAEGFPNGPGQGSYLPCEAGWLTYCSYCIFRCVAGRGFR